VTRWRRSLGGGIRLDDQRERSGYCKASRRTGRRLLEFPATMHLYVTRYYTGTLPTGHTPQYIHARVCHTMYSTRGEPRLSCTLLPLCLVPLGKLAPHSCKTRKTPTSSLRAAYSPYLIVFTSTHKPASTSTRCKRSSVLPI
jgi:hypothetical protein